MPTDEELAARIDQKRFERADALERYKAAANMFRFEGERMLEAKTTHEMEVSLNYLMSYYTQAMAAFREYQAAHLYLDARGIR